MKFGLTGLPHTQETQEVLKLKKTSGRLKETQKILIYFSNTGKLREVLRL